MSEYAVTVAITGREVYYVDADSEAEARRIWSDVEPTIQEVIDAEIQSIVEVEQ